MTEARTCDTIIRAGWVVPVDQDRTTIVDGAVAVVGDQIAAVGSRSELAGWRGEREIDLPHAVVLPGFVDGHNHLFQALARGLGEGQPIWPWLCNFMWPYAIEMSASCSDS